MTSTFEAPFTELELADSSADLLVYAREQKQVSLIAEANLLAAAVAWADQHPPESIADAACFSWHEGGLPLAGEGAPEIAEFAVAEFSAALGMSTDSGKRLIGQAVEIAYRLPRHWARVQSGELPAWRARRLAEQTMTLRSEAATWVDSQLAPYLHRTSFAAQERLVAEAMTRFDPVRAAEEADRAEDRRRVTVSHDQVSFWGTSRIEGEIDLPDALDLEAALQAGAQRMKDLGSTETLDVRRSQALGALARGELTLEYDDSPVDHAARTRRHRQVLLHVHLSEAALGASNSDCLHLARVENSRTVVTADQVRTWCGSHVGGPDVRIVVKPVIDLNEHLHVGAYEVPDRLAEQSELRDHTCVFPWCSRPATRCDKDHTVVHDRDGPTCSCNIAPLCRRHHRLKTQAPWSYVSLEPGSYIWTSPHGYQYLVDHTGTLDVTSTERRGRPRPPHAQQP
jgi:hypothetical protein